MHHRLGTAIWSLIMIFAAYETVTAAPRIETSNFYIIEPPAVAQHAAAYGRITNAGSLEDLFIEVRSQISQNTELHESMIHSGIAHMHKIDTFRLKPGEHLILKPQSYHIMCKRLLAPLKHGDTITLTLVFEKSGEVTVEVPVIK